MALFSNYLWSMKCLQQFFFSVERDQEFVQSSSVLLHHQSSPCGQSHMVRQHQTPESSVHSSQFTFHTRSLTIVTAGDSHINNHNNISCNTFAGGFSSSPVASYFLQHRNMSLKQKCGLARCMVTTELKACSACNEIFYCSREHQVAS